MLQIVRYGTATFEQVGVSPKLEMDDKPVTGQPAWEIVVATHCVSLYTPSLSDSRPELWWVLMHLKQVQKAKANAILSLHNVGCSACSSLVERELKRLPGVVAVNVNHVADSVLVEFDPTGVSVDGIRDYLKKRSSDFESKDVGQED